MTRLAAFAIAAMFATTAYAQTEYEHAGNWQIETEVDPFTDIKNVAAAAFSIMDDDTNYIILRCREGKYDVYLTNNNEKTFSSTRVGVRIGEANPTFSRWSYGAVNTALFSRSPAKLMKMILDSNATRLVFRLERDEGTETSVFSLDGFDVAYLKVTEACGG